MWLRVIHIVESINTMYTKKANNHIHTDSQKLRRSYLAMQILAAGDVWRYMPPSKVSAEKKPIVERAEVEYCDSRFDVKKLIQTWKSKRES